VQKILKLAFLPPRATEMILRGEQPQHLALTALIDQDLPLAWRDQVRLLRLPHLSEVAAAASRTAHPRRRAAFPSTTALRR
jgi:hypothetical protein